MRHMECMGRLMPSVLGAVFLSGAAMALPSTEPRDREAKFRTWMEKRLAAKAEAVRRGGAPVVFLGDSITHNWENANGRQQWAQYFASAPYRALNLGWSGDRTENLLWRIEQGELDGYEAKAVVLMIGTNNRGLRGSKETVIDTLAGIWRVVEAIRAKQPTARIILHPIFPRGEKPTDAYRVHNDAVNRELAKFCDGKRVLWCDFTDQLMEADGTLPSEVMPDYLHPEAFGYEVWAAALKPFLDFCLTAKDGDWFPNRYATRLAKGVCANVQPRACLPQSAIGEKHDWDPGENWWIRRLIDKQEEAQRLKDKDGYIDLVFLGDSITHNWEGARGPGSDFGGKPLAALRKKYSVLNLGFGGDDTRRVLWRLRNGELDNYRARCIQLLVGTNNGDKPAETAQGVRLILDEISRRQPQAKTLLLAVFPAGRTPDHPHRVRNAALNAQIKEFADGEKVIWVDFGERFIEPDGTIAKKTMGDYLHPGHRGYDIWFEEVAPLFRAAVRRGNPSAASSERQVR